MDVVKRAASAVYTSSIFHGKHFFFFFFLSIKLIGIVSLKCTNKTMINVFLGLVPE